MTAYLTAESFIQYTSYSQQFSNASLTLVGLVTDYQRIIVSIRRLNEIEETLNGQHERFGKNVTINEKGNIELCDVTFGYGEKVYYGISTWKLRRILSLHWLVIVAVEKARLLS